MRLKLFLLGIVGTLLLSKAYSQEDTISKNRCKKTKFDKCCRAS